MGKDIGSFIVCSPGIVGGRPRIDGTRVSVRSIVTWYKRGHSAEEIADQYDQLSLPQIYSALAYYHANRMEIETDMAAEESEYDRLIETHYEYRKHAYFYRLHTEYLKTGRQHAGIIVTPQQRYSDV